jgi:hypothetical protein
MSQPLDFQRGHHEFWDNGRRKTGQRRSDFTYEDLGQL